MVRQASCDVSDRNDKGSPDTVWQILGSCRGSFSCSETSAAQTQDPTLASRKETLRSERGGLAKFSKGVCSACLLELGPMLLSADQWEYGQQDSWSPPDGPRNQCHLVPTLAPSPLAEMGVFQGLVTQWSGDLLSPLHTKQDKRTKTWSPECSLEIPPILGPSSFPGPPSENEEAALTTGCQLLTLRTFMHIPSGNCPGSN